MAFPSEHVILATRNYIEAEQTAELLESAGIVCYVKNAALSGVFGDTSAFSIGVPSEPAIEVIIHIRDAERAERVLAQGNAN